MGIPLGPADFTRGAAKPIDDTMTTATIITRDAIVSGVRFQGMCVFVVADTKTYQLKAGILNTDWVEYGGAAPAVDLKTDLFTAAGSASVTLTAVPGAKTNLFVSIQGVTQNDASYSVAGAVLTFDTIPPTGSLIQVKYGAQLAIGTPSDGTVTTLKIVDNAVTTAKIANSSITTQKMAPRLFTTYAGTNQVIVSGGQVVNFNTLIVDTDSLVVTGAVWKFTANRAMRIRVNSLIKFASAAWTAGNIIQLFATKTDFITSNTEVYDLSSFVVPNTGTQNLPSVQGVFEFEMLTNDFLQITVNQNSGASKTTTGNLQQNYVQISEVR